MRRTNNSYTVPDAINHSTSKDFTQVPNQLLRNPNISGKAKSILFLLLSNKKGWSSYIATMQKMMKEGESALRSGIAELEEYGYLVRIRYRNKKTKQWEGQFWSYTDTPWSFTGIQETAKELDKHGLELVLPENLHVENRDVGFPDVESNRLITCNSKKTKRKNINSSEKDEEKTLLVSIPESDHDLIKPSHFNKFWELYPKKKSKGKAKTKWNSLCRKKDRPSWKEIKEAIQAQKKTEQWQTEKYIPHPSTWINQSRWLDDPKEMTGFSNNSKKTKVTHRRKDGHKYPTKGKI